MDPLAHTLLGAALARSGLSRRTELGGLALVIGANLPDIDVLAHLGGTDASLACRRGWTHGAPALLLLPLLLTATLILWRRIRKGQLAPLHPGWLLSLAATGVWSHPMLDWLNTYGIRLLFPLEDRWFYGDVLFIMDPWLWLLLGGGTYLAGSRARGWRWGLLATLLSLPFLLDAIPLGSRLAWGVGLSILLALRLRLGVGRSRPGVATAALLLGALYLTAVGLSNRMARARLEGGLAGPGAEVLMVGPLPADPLHWDVLLAQGDSYRWGRFSWRDGGRLEPGGTIARGPRDHPAVIAARASPSVRGFVGWARFPFYEVEQQSDGGWRVHLLDARYTRERSSGFGAAQVELDHRFRPLEAPAGSS